MRGLICVGVVECAVKYECECVGGCGETPVVPHLTRSIEAGSQPPTKSKITVSTQAISRVQLKPPGVVCVGVGGRGSGERRQ